MGQFDLTGREPSPRLCCNRSGESGNAGYRLRNIGYEFAGPVPEPATVLLLGTGLAAIVRARRRTI